MVASESNFRARDLSLHEDRLTQAGLDAFDRIGIHASEYISGNLLQAYFQILERGAIVTRQIERLVLGPAFFPPFALGFPVIVDQIRVPIKPGRVKA